MQRPFEDLSRLTDALYQARLNKMRGINEREAILRQKIAELDRFRRSNATLPAEELHTVRQIGADVLWEGWVSRTRADLNTQLARVLAQKAQMTAELRQAFGKQIAAAAIRDSADRDFIKGREKRYRQSLDDLQLMKTRKI